MKMKTKSGGISIVEISNQHIQVQLCNYGARIISIKTPDRSGQLQDIIQGPKEVEQIVKPQNKYRGALIGRMANRVEQAQFELDGSTYQLEINESVHCLHSGVHGLQRKIWEVKQSEEDAVLMTYTSPNGEGGFPGNMDVSIEYKLEGNQLIALILARTDQACPINLTLHPYFNLHGDLNGNIIDHQFRFNADRFLRIRKDKIPIGERSQVAQSAFDFTESKTLIGIDLSDEYRDQLEFGSGFDHHFIKSENSDSDMMATAYSRETGLQMKISSSLPGFQFYSGGHLKDRTKMSSKYFCIEPQFCPNGINELNFLDRILYPGELYKSYIKFEFSTV